jgi:hypothetical protein
MLLMYVLQLSGGVLLQESLFAMLQDIEEGTLLDQLRVNLLAYCFLITMNTHTLWGSIRC